MVGAVMALMHLDGPGAERQASIWWPRQMPKTGLPVATSFLDLGHGIFAGRGRIARAVRQEDAVGLERQDVLGRVRRRHDGDPAAGPARQAQDVALHAVVDGDDMVLRRVGWRP